MKILSLSLDNSILDKTSALAERTIGYGDLVERYTIIVPSRKNDKIELSEKIMIYGSGGGNKLAQLFNIYKMAQGLLGAELGSVITVQDQYYLALMGLRLAKKYRVGLEIQVHGFEKYYGLRKLIAKYVLPRASVVRAVSQRLKKQLTNEFNVKEERITVVPIFVDVKSKVESRKSKVGVKDNFIFLTVGRLVPVKNISLQIEAMAEIIKKYPQAKLWIVGDGPELAKLKVKSEKLKVEDKVKFFGQKTKKELNEIYGQADVFVLTSDSEGWGLSVIEAAVHGVPVIMTDVGCAGEVIKNNESGLIISVGDGEGLKNCMIKIMENIEMRRSFAEQAGLAIKKLLNKEQTMQLYKKSWERAIINN